MMKRNDSKQQFEKIIKIMRSNPEKGLRRFYDAYAKIITVTAKCICRSMDKVDEVVDNVLIKVWKMVDRIRSVDNPEGWIYTVTVNVAKDVMKERYTLPLCEDILSSGNEFQEIIDMYSFYWMISELSEIEQTIMVRRFVLSYTFQEIAEEIDKPLPTISSLYYRALDKVKKKINEENKTFA